MTNFMRLISIPDCELTAWWNSDTPKDAGFDPKQFKKEF